MDFNKIRALLDSQGVCHLQSCNFEDAYAIADELGEIVKQADVRVKHTAVGPLVTSDRALDIHTDHHDVNFIIWYCFRNSDEGGYTQLSDFNNFSHYLESSDIEILREVYLYEHDVFGSGNSTAPLVKVDDFGKARIYFSFWLVDESDKVKESVKLFYRLAKEHVVEFKLAARDILIIDNQRVLHGRTRIGGDKSRYLKRIWVIS